MYHNSQAVILMWLLSSKYSYGTLPISFHDWPIGDFPWLCSFTRVYQMLHINHLISSNIPRFICQLWNRTRHDPQNMVAASWLEAHLQLPEGENAAVFYLFCNTRTDFSHEIRHMSSLCKALCENWPKSINRNFWFATSVCKNMSSPEKTHNFQWWRHFLPAKTMTMIIRIIIIIIIFHNDN